MSVYNYILDTGTIVPDAAVIQTEVQTEYTNVFGTDLNVTSPSTPQGLLINAETQARIAVATNNATLANQINPNFAGGVFLDAILSLMGSQRTAATVSTVLCTLSGVAGTLIPAGSLAVDTNSNQWSLVNDVTIPLGGSTGTPSSILFEAVNTGAIIIDASSLTSILSNVLGWDSITNTYGNGNPSEGGTIGQSTQTDAAARQYRNNTLYLQSNGLAGSIIAALTATETVNSLYFQENPSTSTTINNIAMAANSIYCCIDGTNEQAIAATLTATKSAGCAYTNGASQTNISYAYTVPISGQVINVLWDTPDIISIGVEITVILNTPTQNYQTVITNAILNYAAGQVSGLAGLTVGASVSPFEISAAVGIQYPGIYVSNCLINNLTGVTQTGTLSNTSVTVTDLVDVYTALYVGMQVSGTGIQSGSTIASLVSNTSITLSLAATTSSSETLTFTGVYEAATIDIEPWQLAQITSGNITVSLA